MCGTKFSRAMRVKDWLASHGELKALKGCGLDSGRSWVREPSGRNNWPHTAFHSKGNERRRLVGG